MWNFSTLFAHHDTKIWHCKSIYSSIFLKVRSHQTRMTQINRAIRAKLDAWRFWVYSLLSRWILLHNRREFASWEGLLPGSSNLVAKCIPVFVKVRRCIYSSGYPHTTTITLSTIVVSDFLPPLVMTSLLEQAPDWLTRREYPPKFRFFYSREKNAQFAPPHSRE